MKKYSPPAGDIIFAIFFTLWCAIFIKGVTTFYSTYSWLSWLVIIYVFCIPMVIYVIVKFARKAKKKGVNSGTAVQQQSKAKHASSPRNKRMSLTGVFAIISGIMAVLGLIVFMTDEEAEPLVPTIIFSFLFIVLGLSALFSYKKRNSLNAQNNLLKNGTDKVAPNTVQVTETPPQQPQQIPSSVSLQAVSHFDSEAMRAVREYELLQESMNVLKYTQDINVFLSRYETVIESSDRMLTYDFKLDAEFQQYTKETFEGVSTQYKEMFSELFGLLIQKQLLDAQLLKTPRGRINRMQRLIDVIWNHPTIMDLFPQSIELQIRTIQEAMNCEYDTSSQVTRMVK